MATVTATDFKDLDDEALARHVAAGNTVALEALMRRYNQPLYRAARSITRDDAEAEDVVQETYLQAYTGIHSFRSESRFSTWLTRIAINEALARVRKSRRRAAIIPLVGHAALDADPDEDVFMTQNAAENPDSVVLRGEVRRLIERKIDDLPDAFRSVFVLRALEEMSVEETAACLGVPEATVRSRYFRARSLLREALALEVDLTIESAFGFDGARCDRIVATVLTRLQDPSQRGN
ncbi:MAG TPA: RNA polymerase sigma factor [Moraxellaceae bacterium]|nr:RNA polymerase sigma factor [Moraxellaceae bacterium]